MTHLKWATTVGVRWRDVILRLSRGFSARCVCERGTREGADKTKVLKNTRENVLLAFSKGFQAELILESFG